MRLYLVGADREDKSCLLQPVEGADDARKKARRDANVLAVMHHEAPEQLFEVIRRESAAFAFEAALDQRPRAGADHVACLRDREPRKAFLVEDHVEGRHQVASGIGQRPIEIEDGDRRGKMAIGLGYLHATRESSFGMI